MATDHHKIHKESADACLIEQPNITANIKKNFDSPGHMHPTLDGDYILGRISIGLASTKGITLSYLDQPSQLYEGSSAIQEFSEFKKNYIRILKVDTYSETESFKEYFKEEDEIALKGFGENNLSLYYLGLGHQPKRKNRSEIMLVENPIIEIIVAI